MSLRQKDLYQHMDLGLENYMAEVIPFNKPSL